VSIFLLTIHKSNRLFTVTEPSKNNYIFDFSADKPREQVNLLSAYIDGSNVYGLDAKRAEILRTFSGGK
jgi:hypothetical protein